jgi:arylformamidase
MLASDWRGEAEIGVELVPAAYSISGLFDLRPLLQTRLNGALGLTAEEAGRLSPMRWAPPGGLVLDAVLGEAESAEFHRQSREIVDTWRKHGVSARYGTVQGANHFTAIAPLADPQSAMVERILELRALAA